MEYYLVGQTILRCAAHSMSMIHECEEIKQEMDIDIINIDGRWLIQLDWYECEVNFCPKCGVELAKSIPRQQTH